jgi:dCTP deaminase
VSALVDCDILAALATGAIVIDPFDRACLGTNSYDIHLAPTLRVYKKEFKIDSTHPGYPHSPESVWELPLDVRVPRETIDVVIPESGLILVPGELYLASTVERTESRFHLPMLNGRSSLGRLGLSIHVTAGTGDVGFRGHWTMELFVVKRLRVYPNIPIGQLLWLTTENEPLVPYGSKSSAKYSDAGAFPQASKLHEELGGG